MVWAKPFMIKSRTPTPTRKPCRRRVLRQSGKVVHGVTSLFGAYNVDRCVATGGALR